MSTQAADYGLNYRNAERDRPKNRREQDLERQQVGIGHEQALIAAQRLGHHPRRRVDRYGCQADSRFQNRADLGAAQRRRVHALVGQQHAVVSLIESSTPF
jgi:hypothetical protein